MRKLGVNAAALALYGTTSAWALAGRSARASSAQPVAYVVPKRPLGSTGAEASVIWLAGPSQAPADADADHSDNSVVRLIQRALDRGVCCFDTSPVVCRGLSETNIGAALKEQRNRAFLATRTCDHTYDGTLRSFEASLRRLHADTIDLYQLAPIEAPEAFRAVFSDAGAIRALRRLRDERVVGLVGVCGRPTSPLLLRSLREFAFDTVAVDVAPGWHGRSGDLAQLLSGLRSEAPGLVVHVPYYGDQTRDCGDGPQSVESGLKEWLALADAVAVSGALRVRDLDRIIAAVSRAER